MRKNVMLGACALVVFGFGVSVTAAAPGQHGDGRISVSYGDLNIDSTAGARVLYSRLKRASEKACRMDSYLALGSISRVAARKQCYAEVLDQAVANINSNALASIHSS